MAVLVLMLLVMVAGHTWARVQVMDKQPWVHGHVPSGSQQVTWSASTTGQQVTWSGSLLDRVDAMERLLLDQRAQLTRHDVILSQTKAELSETKTELSETKDKLSKTQTELSETKTELSKTKIELSETKTETKTELSKIQIKLSETETETKTELSKTQTELSRTRHELSDTKHRLHQLEQAVRRCPQQSLEPQQSATRLQQYPPHHQGGSSQPSNAESLNSTDRRLGETEAALVDSRNTTGVVDTPDALISGEGENPSPHDVMTRADDSGPLEVVVNQLGQKVTEMGADITALKTQTTALQNTNSQQDNAIHDARSSTYIHWGSSQCSNASDLVYSGVVGGSHYTHSGAATNYLCLTMTPVFSDHPIPGGMAYLYGGEYETQDSHQDQDTLCAVCRSSFSTSVMIPGTNTCTSGWHRLYSGFLMAGYSGHAAGSEYICVDSQMESSTHSDADDNGKLLYYTVTQCGSLPCHPYVNNKIVTCVVCGN